MKRQLKDQQFNNQKMRRNYQLIRIIEIAVVVLGVLLENSKEKRTKFSLIWDKMNHCQCKNNISSSSNNNNNKYKIKNQFLCTRMRSDINNNNHHHNILI